MAEQCGNPECKRADLLQADVANLQCLACGEQTSIATGEMVTKAPKAAPQSNTGAKIIRLDVAFGKLPANDFDRRDRDVEPEEVTVNDPDPEEVEPEDLPDIDLKSLSVEQLEKIEAIVQGE